jgi:hypothetical protein
LCSIIERGLLAQFPGFLPSHPVRQSADNSKQREQKHTRVPARLAFGALTLAEVLAYTASATAFLAVILPQAALEAEATGRRDRDAGVGVGVVEHQVVVTNCGGSWIDLIRTGDLGSGIAWDDTSGVRKNGEAGHDGED